METMLDRARVGPNGRSVTGRQPATAKSHAPCRSAGRRGHQRIVDRATGTKEVDLWLRPRGLAGTGPRNAFARMSRDRQRGRLSEPGDDECRPMLGFGIWPVPLDGRGTSGAAGPPLPAPPLLVSDLSLKRGMGSQKLLLLCLG